MSGLPTLLGKVFGTVCVVMIGSITSGPRVRSAAGTWIVSEPSVNVVATATRSSPRTTKASP